MKNEEDKTRLSRDGGERQTPGQSDGLRFAEHLRCLTGQFLQRAQLSGGIELTA